MKLINAAREYITPVQHEEVDERHGVFPIGLGAMAFVLRRRDGSGRRLRCAVQGDRPRRQIRRYGKCEGL